MTLLPIVERELRVACRRVPTYSNRTVTAGVIFLLATFILLSMRGGMPTHLIGKSLFYSLVGVLSLTTLILGVMHSADCISREKRDGTLGLLFLTDLRGWDVVLGKLTAEALSLLLGVLATLPVLALCLLFGGVNYAELGRCALGLLNLLLFVVSMSILVSSGCSRANRAAGLSFLLVFFFLAILPLCGFAWMLHLERSGQFRAMGPATAQQFMQPFLILNPGSVLVHASSSLYLTEAGFFWQSLGAQFALSASALLGAIAWVPRAWQERPDRTGWQAWKAAWKRRMRFARSPDLVGRTLVLEKSPVLWLVEHGRNLALGPWAIVLAPVAIGAYFSVREGVRFEESGWLIFYVMTGNGLIKGWVGSESGRRFAEDRQTGAIELMLSTPVPLSELERGQRLALIRAAWVPLLLQLGLQVLLLWWVLRFVDEGFLLVGLWVLSLLMLPVDLAALSRWGIWQAVAAKKPAYHSQGNIGFVLMGPWFMLWLSGAAIGFLTLITGWRINPPAWFFVMEWLVFSLGVDAYAWFQGKRKIEAEFRRRALTVPDLEGVHGFWRRLGRWFGKRTYVRTVSPGK